MSKIAILLTIALAVILIISLSSCAGKAIPKPSYTLGDRTNITRDEDGVYSITFKTEGEYNIYVGSSVNSINWKEPIATITGKEILLTQFNNNKRKYFGVEDSNGERTIRSERRLALKGAPNFRDIGGFMTKDNRMVNWGLLYRSSKLSDLKNDDMTYLQSLNLKSVCDFRYTSEIDEDPDRIPAGAKYYHFPIGGKEGLFYQDLKRRVLKEGLRRKEAKKEFVKVMELFADSAAHDFKPVMDLIIKGDANTPLVYHCSGGKDRTGYMTMIILATLGVEKETIEKEYLLSNFYRYKTNRGIARKARIIGVDSETLEYILVVQKDYFDAVFDVIENKYGGLDNYLLEKYDITPEIRQQLIDRYTIDPMLGVLTKEQKKEMEKELEKAKEKDKEKANDEEKIEDKEE